MNPYKKYVLPHLLNLAMQDKASEGCRSEMVPKAKGRALDVGIGSGLNFQFLGDAVTEIYGIDPSVELLRMAKRNAKKSSLRPRLFLGSAEQLPFQDNMFDTVLLTWTLCTIPHPDVALREMSRVLKPTGELIFAEHGHAPDEKVFRRQIRWNPVWQKIAGGCHLYRKAPDLIRSDGFEILEMEESYLPGPKFVSYTYRGVGKKAKITPSP